MIEMCYTRIGTSFCFKPRPQNRTFVPLKGSFQNFLRPTPESPPRAFQLFWMVLEHSDIASFISRDTERAGEKKVTGIV